MANLETLELTISADAQKATQGIGSLVRSLSFLDTAVGKSVSGLKKLNAELKTLKGFGGIKLPGLASAGATAVTRSAKKTPEEIRAWQKSLEHTRTYSNTTGSYGMIPEDVSRRLNPQWYQNPNEQARKAQQYLRDNGGTASWVQTTKAVTEQNTALKQTTSAAKSATTAIKSTSSETKKLGNAQEETKKKSSSFAKAFSRIGRIFSTMMIRTAIRSLIKAFGESWQAAYQFSSKMNGSFAKAVDASRTLLADTATTLVQTFAPVLQALVPVLYVVAGAVQYLCNAIQSLLRLIGLSSDLFGANTQSINKYTKAAGGANKANKNLLASWDQLNIIQSQSGGGGGSGGGYKPGALSGLVSEELGAILGFIVGEAMLALGVILACTGHIGIGVGLMAIGAASIVKTYREDWKKLPDNIKKTIATIGVVTGITAIALGLILAFTGHVALGIGLMLFGGLSAGAAVEAVWGDKIKNNLTQVASDIADMLAVGGVLSAVFGLILLFTGAGTGLGLGLILAGGIELGTAVALNWTEISGKVQQIMTDIASWFTTKWNDISKAIDDAWQAVSKWWNENVASNVSAAWESIKVFFSGLWDGVSNAASKAWDSIKKWWGENIATPISTAWDSVSTFFADLWGDATQGTGIAGAASIAWNNITEWWETNVSDNIKKEGAWGGVKGFFKGIWGDAESGTGIAGWASNAWSVVSQFFKDGLKSSLESKWSGIKEFFDGVFAPIRNVLSEIWEFIKSIFGVDSTVATYDVNVNYNAKWNGDFSNPYLPDDLIPFELRKHAAGAYGIPNGDLFIANEAGAELVGSMNGKTTVANQGQIIAGISSGVRDANAEQNALLRRQNELLMGILEKSGNISVEPSASWGRFNQRSAEMWSMATGR